MRIYEGKNVVRIYEDTRYINIRGLFGLTLDERESWEIILARAMNQFNHRRFLGLRVYKFSNKKCQWANVKHLAYNCENNVQIGLIFKRGNKYYSILLCRLHYDAIVHEMYNDLADKVSNFIVSLKAYVERMMNE